MFNVDAKAREVGELAFDCITALLSESELNLSRVAPENRKEPATTLRLGRRV